MNMINIFEILWKKFRALGTLAAVIVTSCTNCPKEEIDAMLAAIPDFETRNRGVDLKGWVPSSVTSKAGGETYNYYHMPSKKKDAPTFVLIHGMFLDGRTFLNFGKLAEDFELISLELPHDSMYYTGYNSDFPKLLQVMLDALGLERIHLGGVSLGGQIAMFYVMADHKTQVDGLALISTDLSKDEKELKKNKSRARAALKITRDEDNRIICMINKLSNRKKKNATPEDEEVMKIFSLKKPSFYREVLYCAIHTESVHPLKTIDVPTVVIHGTEDSTIPFDSGKNLVNYIPSSELKVVQGGEHGMAYTRADEVVGYIREKFVKK